MTAMAQHYPPTMFQLGPSAIWPALKALRNGFGGMLPVLEMLHRELGDVFQITLPRFRSIFVADPELLRRVLVDERNAYLWRPEGDPVTRLLRSGMLVTDGQEHDHLRHILEPSNFLRHFVPRSYDLWQVVDRVLTSWRPGRRYDMLVEMRKVALLAFEAVYFSHDLSDELPHIWEPLLKALGFISPGWWILSGAKASSELIPLDMHLHALIRKRRAMTEPPNDLLTHVVQAIPEDNGVRDQLLTMLIAGHDTCTANLAWALYLLGRHHDWLTMVTSEVRDTLGQEPPNPANIGKLGLLDRVIKETLRLYPPIHVGNRFTAYEVNLAGYRIPAGTRVMLSYYLVHRHPAYWEDPVAFRPDRWVLNSHPKAFTYLPFGGGPRNCIGAAFAQHEVPLVLARILQRCDLHLARDGVWAYMGATLEPRPGIFMDVERVQ